MLFDWFYLDLFFHNRYNKATWLLNMTFVLNFWTKKKSGQFNVYLGAPTEREFRQIMGTPSIYHEKEMYKKSSLFIWLNHQSNYSLWYKSAKAAPFFML